MNFNFKPYFAFKTIRKPTIIGAKQNLSLLIELIQADTFKFYNNKNKLIKKDKLINALRREPIVTVKSHFKYKNEIFKNKFDFQTDKDFENIDEMYQLFFLKLFKIKGEIFYWMYDRSDYKNDLTEIFNSCFSELNNNYVEISSNSELDIKYQQIHLKLISEFEQRFMGHKNMN